ncbi:hypothetical protein HUT16_11525 [Kitasatospora sp. NA04385]|uniref:hypothetical protein n=1 Tax=Kitasatospora sp. NA04385 TaxID=2742135 RepID=UPI00159057B1|nr:hypothetical protein [Kitasatospora sp. NA04385]QKW19614.1 hypothetical protein HUT16_11525 [Kitasatospora sp. NA04385]
MSRSELPEVDEAEDRPAIGAARLEAMFDGLRREVASGVPAPESAEVVRRGQRRRQRRRAGALAGAGALGVAALWTVASVPQFRTGHGVAGVPVEQSALPRPKTSFRVAPTPDPSYLVVPSIPAWVLAPLDSAEPGVRALALDVARMPKVVGGYGPWSAVERSVGVPSSSPSTSTSASPSLSPSPSAFGSPSASASAGNAGGSTRSPSAPSSSTAGVPSASASANASEVEAVVAPSAEVFADGCVTRLVAVVGAVQAWGEVYTDGGDAVAHQYVLGFGSPGQAESAGSRLLAGADCVVSGGGWTVEERSTGVTALGLREPSAIAEEVAVHVSGSMVAVLTVHRSGRGVVPEAGVSEPFRVAAEEFRALSSPEPSGPSGTPGPSGSPSRAVEPLSR